MRVLLAGVAMVLGVVGVLYVLGDGSVIERKPVKVEIDYAPSRS